MSCNGCRVLRRGCGEKCPLRLCLDWIDGPQAQGNATLFVSKFFGRSDLMAFISAVPDNKRPALFQSLLYEACGRTVNPVNGAVGLLSTGNWHVCQAAVETVLTGGTLRPVFSLGITNPDSDEASEAFHTGSSWRIRNQYYAKSNPLFMQEANNQMTLESTYYHSSPDRYFYPASFGSSDELSDVSGSYGSGGYDGVKGAGEKEPKLLNLFV